MFVCCVVYCAVVWCVIVCACRVRVGLGFNALVCFGCESLCGVVWCVFVCVARLCFVFACFVCAAVV